MGPIRDFDRGVRHQENSERIIEWGRRTYERFQDMCKGRQANVLGLSVAVPGDQPGRCV